MEDSQRKKRARENETPERRSKRLVAQTNVLLRTEQKKQRRLHRRRECKNQRRERKISLTKQQGRIIKT